MFTRIKSKNAKWIWDSLLKKGIKIKKTALSLIGVGLITFPILSTIACSNLELKKEEKIIEEHMVDLFQKHGDKKMPAINYDWFLKIIKSPAISNIIVSLIFFVVGFIGLLQATKYISFETGLSFMVISWFWMLGGVLVVIFKRSKKEINKTKEDLKEEKSTE